MRPNKTDAAGTSRDALQMEYRGANAQAFALEKPAAPKEGKKGGRNPIDAVGTAASKARQAGLDIASKRTRKLDECSTAPAGQVTDAKAAKPKKAKGGKSKAIREAKFKDPDSE